MKGLPLSYEQFITMRATLKRPTVFDTVYRLRWFRDENGTVRFSSGMISTPEEIVKCLAQPDVYIAQTSRVWPRENVSYSLVRKTKDVEENIPVINEQLIERTFLDLGTSGRLNARKHEEGTPGDADYRVTIYCFLYEEEETS